nr:hypothetical protein 26 [Pelagibacteraceae bacterium]
MMNTEYDKEYVFDIDAYLVENYPTMNQVTRRSICSLSINDWIDDEGVIEYIDACVADYAKNKLQLNKLEEEEDDKEDENCVGG